MFRSWLSSLALLIGLLPTSISAQSVPAYIPVEGNLATSDGMPRDGEVTAIFRLYTEATDGAAFYAEQIQLDIKNGEFITYLGTGTPADLGDGTTSPAFDMSMFASHSEGTVFLGVSIDADPELSPRLPFGSTPFAGYAQMCGDAATLGGLTAAELASGAAAGGLVADQIPDLGHLYFERSRFAWGSIVTPTDPLTGEASVFDPKGGAPVTGTLSIDVPDTLGCNEPLVWVSANTGGERNFISWSVRKGTLSSGGPEFVVDWINLYHEEGFDISFNWLAYCP